MSAADYKNIVPLIFSAFFSMALLINALLFIPQAIKIWREQTARGVSLITFLGFWIIQLVIVIHGIIKHDYLLALGYLLSMLTCGVVILLAVYFRHNNSYVKGETCTLMERLDFLEDILALMPGHVYWMDRDGVYQGCNDAQAKSAGLKNRKEIIGKHNKDLPWNYHTDILPEALDKINQEVLESGKTIVTEEPAQLANGEQATFLSSKVPMRNQANEVIGMVGISIDITQLKNTEKSLQETKAAAEVANRLKTEFMRNMEHDIRTPFSGILGLSQCLWEEEIDGTKKENLNLIVQSAKELLDYCNTILDFEKIESGASPVLEKKFSLKQLIEKAIKLEHSAAQHKHLQLTFKHDETIHKMLLGDSDRLYRILLNLLGNAIKFTNAGSIELKTKLLEQTNQQIIIQLTIQDSGIGISNEQKDLIFERFTRLSQSNKGFYKGLGLGLQVVKRFIHELQGEIDVTSKIGKGTTFTCTLPFRLPLTQT